MVSIAPLNLTLLQLPIDVLCCIVEYLDLKDCTSMSGTCLLLHHVVYSTPRSLECDEATFRFIKPFLQRATCIRCLHLNTADSKMLHQVCGCICHQTFIRSVQICGCENVESLENFSLIDVVRKLQITNCNFEDISIMKKLQSLEELLILFPSESFNDNIFIQIW
jgi:hypothetical protein